MPPNLVPPQTPFQPEPSFGQQIIASEVIIAPPPTNQLTELTLSSTSAPLEALHQVLPQSIKRTRKLISHNLPGNVVLVMLNQCNLL